MHRHIECLHNNRMIASVTFLEDTARLQMMVMFDMYTTNVRILDGKEYPTTMVSNSEIRVEASYKHLSKAEILAEDRKIVLDFLTKKFSTIPLNEVNTSYTSVDFRYNIHFGKEFLGYIIIKENYIDEATDISIRPIDTKKMPYDFSKYRYGLPHDKIIEDYINRHLSSFPRAEIIISKNF